MRKKKEPFPPKEGAKEGTGMAPAWKVIRASESPLIDRSHEGSADNECGYENGYVIEDGRGTYHMLITEMFTRGTKNANGWVPARIGYWTSADGTAWTRVRTIVQGNDRAGDPQEHSWSPSFFWNESANAWEIFWRGNRAVFRCRSKTAGREGIGAEYEEIGQVWPPLCDRAGKEREFASFGNIFRTKGGRTATFFCHTEEQNGRMQWLASLAFLDEETGRWCVESEEPVFLYCENPFVYEYDGHYYCVFDDLSCQRSIGIGFSEDGEHWESRVIDLTDSILWANTSWYVNSVRTPLSLIREKDGSFTVFFTAAEQKDGYFSVGKVQLALRQAPKTPSLTEYAAAAEGFAWEHGECSADAAFGEERCLPLRYSAKKRRSLLLRCVDPLPYRAGNLFCNGFAAENPLYVTCAGLRIEQSGKRREFLVNAEGQALFLQEGKLVAAKRLKTPPYIYKEMCVCVKNGVTYFRFEGKVLFRVQGDLLSGSACGALCGGGHWHFSNIKKTANAEE